MDIKKVYSATRHNSGLKLSAIDALHFARTVIATGANYSNRVAESIQTAAGGFFATTPTEYRRASAWNPEFTPEHSNRKCRFLENAENDRLTGLRYCGEAHSIDRNLPMGWYCDNFQDETYKPAVWQLPGKNGEARYLSGYLEPWNDGALIDVSSYYAAIGEDHAEAMRGAARDADSMAEVFSEQEREYQTTESARNRIEECREEIREARKEHSAIVAEIRDHATTQKALNTSPKLCEAIREKLLRLRSTVSELRREMKRLDAEPWTINPDFY